MKTVYLPILAAVLGVYITLSISGCGGAMSSSGGSGSSSSLGVPPANLPFQLMNDVCKDQNGNDTDARVCIAALVAAGTAAGNVDDYYLNQDGDHAPIDVSQFPGAVRITDTRYGYTDPANTLTPQEIQAIYDDPMKVKVGNGSFVFNYPGQQVSVTRFKMLTNQAQQMYDNEYTKNFFEWHVEHTDHDSADMLFFMSAMMTNSQGSSGSELDEMRKYFHTLSAFSPATKDKLKSTGTLMATMQMLERITRVNSNAEYLTGLAHPNAFDDSNNLHKMIRMANHMTPGTVPPVARLKVISDTFVAGFGMEQYFTTPASIARGWVVADPTPRKIAVSLEDSIDVNGRPLKYTWALLRGDPNKVAIKLLNSAGTIAEITFQPHGQVAVPLPGGGQIQSALESVGAFVSNGFYYSAPVFVTSFADPIASRAF